MIELPTQDCPTYFEQYKLYCFNYLYFQWSSERQMQEVVWPDIPPPGYYLSCAANAYRITGNMTHTLKAKLSSCTQAWTPVSR